MEQRLIDVYPEYVRLVKTALRDIEDDKAGDLALSLLLADVEYSSDLARKE